MDDTEWANEGPQEGVSPADSYHASRKGGAQAGGGGHTLVQLTPLPWTQAAGHNNKATQGQMVTLLPTAQEPGLMLTNQSA